MDDLQLKISSLANDGRGIGFLNSNAKTRGKVVLVTGALPEQTAIIKIEKNRKSFCEAKAIKILHPSPGLSAALCPHLEECGGCPLQIMPYKKQLYWKQLLAKDNLKKIGLFSDAQLAMWEETLPSPQLQNFRNKMEFAFGKNKNNLPTLGLRSIGSHRVFNIEKCIAVSDKAIQTAIIFRELAFKSGFPVFADDHAGFWRFLILRESGYGMSSRWVASCITSKGNPETRKIVKKIGQQLLSQSPWLQAFIHEERKNRDFLPVGQNRICILDEHGRENPEAAIIQKNLQETNFELDCSSFFQVNSEAAELLAKEIKNFHVSGNKLLDLYSGCGAPGLLIAKDFKKTIAIEENKKAIFFACKNAEANGIKNYHGHAGKVEKILPALPKTSLDLALLDPPRSGIDKKSLNALFMHDPKEIIYISCNPATLARDAKLINKRYNIDKIASFDLFPHTPHLECIIKWTKKII